MMRQVIATNIEQSKRLRACGVDVGTADMFWQVPITVSQKKSGEHVLLIKQEGSELYETDIPAWSLSALHYILPKTIIKRLSSDGQAKNNNLYYEFSGHFRGGVPWCNFDGKWEEESRRYCIQYTPFSIFPPYTPISPNSRKTIYLHGEDGRPLIFEDENPIEACIQAMEWITDKKNKVEIMA